MQSLLNFLKSKTNLAGIGLIVLGISEIIAGNLEGGITKIAEGLGFIGVRHAISKGA